MSQLTTQKIHNALSSKGFKEQQTHHEMLWLHVDGKKTSIRTRLSHGIKVYSDPLLGLMAKQLKLSRNQLDDLLACPLSMQQYLQLLREQQAIRD